MSKAALQSFRVSPTNATMRSPVRREKAPKARYGFAIDQKCGRNPPTPAGPPLC